MEDPGRQLIHNAGRDPIWGPGFFRGVLDKRAGGYEFAQTAANLPGFSAGMRIATPVCALVRNDMQKTVTRLRGQGRLPTAIARSEAAGQSASPAVVHSRKQYFRQIRNCYEFAKSTAIFPDFPAGRRCALSVPPAPGQGASSSAPGRRRSRLRFRRRPPPGGRESGWKWDCGQRRSPPPGEKNFPAAGQECG